MLVVKTVVELGNFDIRISRPLYTSQKDYSLEGKEDGRQTYNTQQLF